MPGSPKMRQAMRRIDDQGGEEVFDHLASGMTTVNLIKKLVVSSRVFYKWMRTTK